MAACRRSTSPTAAVRASPSSWRRGGHERVVVAVAARFPVHWCAPAQPRSRSPPRARSAAGEHAPRSPAPPARRPQARDPPRATRHSNIRFRIQSLPVRTSPSLPHWSTRKQSRSGGGHGNVIAPATTCAKFAPRDSTRLQPPADSAWAHGCARHFQPRRRASSVESPSRRR